MGVCADPVEAIRNMLANCVGFQEWAGVDSEVDPVAAAKARTHVDGLPPPSATDDGMSGTVFANYRPYAIVYPAENESYRLRRDASPNCWTLQGQMVVVLSKSYDAVTSPTTQWAQIAAQVEKIVSCETSGEPGLCELSDTPGYLGIQEIVVDFFGRTPLDERNDYGDAFDVVLMIEWGNR